MLASADIFQLSPDFESAVVNVHNVLMPVALIVIFGGFTMIAVQAQWERSMQEVWPAMLRITLVSMGLVFMPQIGNWLGDVVTDIEQAAGINGNPLSAFVAAIKQKFGVDLSSMLGAVSPGGTNGIAQAANGAPTVSTYGYEQPGSPNYDSNSAQGIGSFAFDAAPGSLVPGQSLALSPDLAAGLTPGQSVTVTLANGQTITGVYADKTAASFNGQALHRVDIYDPHQQYSALSGVGITGINGNAPAQGGNLGDFFNTIIHPVETAQIAGLGVFTLVLSFVAAFVQWLVALLQSVLFYSEIALGPLFFGFLLVRGLENIAKGFILSFLAISLWRIAFLITGLITQLLLGLAVNSGNNSIAGAGNAAGLTYLWMICVALWVIFGSIFGPWIISKHVVRGASGMATMLVGAHSAAGKVLHVGAGAASRLVNAPVSLASATRMSGATTSFARRPPPINGRN
jgi:hypothetical protein